KKQMDNRTQMVIVLQDGEELRGSIEWYDRGCIKLHRTEGPNLLVLKHNVKYMYKTEDAEGGNGDGEDRSDDRSEEWSEEYDACWSQARLILSSRQWILVTRAPLSPEKPRVGITIGDPAGIGPEIVLKAVAEGEVRAVCSPVVFGSASEIRRQAAQLGL